MSEPTIAFIRPPSVDPGAVSYTHLAGTYLAEYGRNDRLTSVIRFINDILLSAPSIIIGLFVYGAVVVPMGGFSALAGSLALAVIVIPVVLRLSLIHISPRCGVVRTMQDIRLATPPRRAGMRSR